MFKLRNILCCLLLATGMAVPSYSGGCLSFLAEEARKASVPPQLPPAPVYQQPTGPKYGNQAQEALGDLNYAEKRLRKKEISGVPAGPTTAAQLETLRSEIVTVRQFIEENFNQGQSLSSDVRVRARKASEKAADLEFHWEK